MIDIFSIQTMLPFFFVLAVVYGALETAGVFSNRSLKAVISAVMAFFAISNAYVMGLIYSFLPYAAILFIAVFIFGFVKRSLGGKERDNTLIVIIMTLFLLLLASFSIGAENIYDRTEFLWLLGIIVFLAILYAAYKMK